MNQLDTQTMVKVTTPAALLSAIGSATPEQIDTLWSILKYKEIGIYRKVKCGICFRP